MLSTFQSWLARPFSTDQDALHWFLFVGLILVTMILWGMVLRIVGE